MNGDCFLADLETLCGHMLAFVIKQLVGVARPSLASQEEARHRHKVSFKKNKTYL